MAATPGIGGGGGTVARYYASVYPLTSPPTVWPSAGCIAYSPPFTNSFTFSATSLGTGCGGNAPTAPANGQSYTVEVCADTDQSGEGANACTYSVGWGLATLVTAVMPSAPIITITRDNAGNLTAQWPAVTGTPASYHVDLYTCGASTPTTDDPAYAASASVTRSWSVLDPATCYSIQAYANYSWGSGPVATKVASTFSQPPMVTTQQTSTSISGTISYPDWLMPDESSSDGGDGNNPAVSTFEVQLYNTGQLWQPSTSQMLSCLRIAALPFGDVGYTFDTTHGAATCGGATSGFVPLAQNDYAVEVFPISDTGVSWVDTDTNQTQQPGYGVPAIVQTNGDCGTSNAVACVNGAQLVSNAEMSSDVTSYQVAAQALKADTDTYVNDLSSYVSSGHPEYQTQLTAAQGAQSQASGIVSSVAGVVSDLQAYLTGGQTQSALAVADKDLISVQGTTGDLAQSAESMPAQAPAGQSASDAQIVKDDAATALSLAISAESGLAANRPLTDDAGDQLCADAADPHCGAPEQPVRNDASISEGDLTTGGIWDVDPNTGLAIPGGASDDGTAVLDANMVDSTNASASTCANPGNVAKYGANPVFPHATSVELITDGINLVHPTPHGSDSAASDISFLDPNVNCGSPYLPCKHANNYSSNCMSDPGYYHTMNLSNGQIPVKSGTTNAYSPLFIYDQDPNGVAGGHFAQRTDTLSVELQYKDQNNRPDVDCTQLRLDAKFTNTKHPLVSNRNANGALSTYDIGTMKGSCGKTSDTLAVTGKFEDHGRPLTFNGKVDKKFHFTAFMYSTNHKTTSKQHWLGLQTYSGSTGNTKVNKDGSPAPVSTWTTGRIWGGTNAPVWYKLTVRLEGHCKLFAIPVRNGHPLRPIVFNVGDKDGEWHEEQYRYEPHPLDAPKSTWVKLKSC